MASKATLIFPFTATILSVLKLYVGLKLFKEFASITLALVDPVKLDVEVAINDSPGS
jgi:hypothetical protein